jgi:hypothetical protein
MLARHAPTGEDNSKQIQGSAPSLIRHRDQGGRIFFFCGKRHYLRISPVLDREET